MGVTMAIAMADGWLFVCSQPRASRRRARWRQTPRTLRRSQIRLPLVQLQFPVNPRERAARVGDSSGGPPSGHAEGIRKRDLATRHSYTTHCGLRSMMALARRCGDMDVHRTSTTLSPDHRCGNTADG